MLDNFLCAHAHEPSIAKLKSVNTKLGQQMIHKDRRLRPQTIDDTVAFNDKQLEAINALKKRERQLYFDIERTDTLTKVAQEYLAAKEDQTIQKSGKFWQHTSYIDTVWALKQRAFNLLKMDPENAMKHV